jgi:hypothetical protein
MDEAGLLAAGASAQALHAVCGLEFRIGDFAF